MDPKKKFSLHMAETLAMNMEIIMMDKGISAKDIIRKNNELQTPQISSYVIHSIRTGKSFPGIDKLFILGELLNVDPREFLQPRTDKEVSGFLQLNFKQKYVRASLLKRERDKQ